MLIFSLKVIHRRGEGVMSDDEEGNEIDDYNSDDDDESIKDQADNLKVFCTSSLEYLKMKKLTSSDDGRPKVRSEFPILNFFYLISIYTSSGSISLPILRDITSLFAVQYVRRNWNPGSERISPFIDTSAAT